MRYEKNQIEIEIESKCLPINRFWNWQPIPNTTQTQTQTQNINIYLVLVTDRRNNKDQGDSH